MASSAEQVSELSFSDALKLIEKLQSYVVEKNEIIESLSQQVKSFKEERDSLKKEVENLKLGKLDLTGHEPKLSSEMAIPLIIKSTTVTTDIDDTPPKSDSCNTTSESISLADHDSGVCMTSREIASHGESTSYDIVNEKREGENEAVKPPVIPIILSPTKKTVSNRPCLRRHHRSTSAPLYELSVDLRDKTIECLENRYGGKEIANTAARKIQQCYRHWVLSKSFLRMRAFSGRKRSLTFPEKHFQKLKETSLVFYGPDNPVMIVDGEAEENLLPKIRHNSESDIDSTKPVATIEELVSDPSLQLDSHSTDSDDSSDDKSEDLLHDGLVKNYSQRSDYVPDEKDQVDSSTTQVNEEKISEDQRTHSRQSSNSSSSQYDIIDDSNVLTVEGKQVDLIDGSSFTVDKIHHDDTSDGICFSSEKYDEPNYSRSKRQFRIGVNLFNWKPEVGIQYLIDNGLLETDVPKIAEFLRKQTSLSKQKISEYFGNIRNEFTNKVLLEFAKAFDFVGKGVDEALRQFQSYFKLTGEAQTVEKFLMVFSERYVECNPGKVSNNPDTILLLAFALAMLNTDLHNQNVKRRMTVEDFLKNLRGTDDGNDLNQDMLRDMYHRIQKNEFATGADHTTQLYQIENSFIGKVPNLAATHRQFVKLFTVEEVHDPNRKDKPHNRLAFLFNDLLLLAKPRGKGAHGTSGHVFSCKSSYSLLGKKVAEFSNENYPHGVLLLGKLDNKVIATLNLKDENSKKSLVDELGEYIMETNGIENIRIALSAVKQLSWHNRRKEDGRTQSLLIADESHRKRIDKAETTSLMDLRVTNSLGTDDLSPQSSDDRRMSTSASMGDIHEADSPEEESEYEKMLRTNSSSSLDSRLLSNSNNLTPPASHQINHSQSLVHRNSQSLANRNSHHSQTLPLRSAGMKKSVHIFGSWGPKLKKSPNSLHKNVSHPLYFKRDRSPTLPENRNKTPSFSDEPKLQTTMTTTEKRRSFTPSI